MPDIAVGHRRYAVRLAVASDATGVFVGVICMMVGTQKAVARFGSPRPTFRTKRILAPCSRSSMTGVRCR